MPAAAPKCSNSGCQYIVETTILGFQHGRDSLLIGQILEPACFVSNTWHEIKRVNSHSLVVWISNLLEDDQSIFHRMLRRDGVFQRFGQYPAIFHCESCSGSESPCTQSVAWTSLDDLDVLARERMTGIADQCDLVPTSDLLETRAAHHAKLSPVSLRHQLE